MRNIARLLALDLRSLCAAPVSAAAVLIETALFSMSDVLAIIGFLMGAWVISCTRAICSPARPCWLCVRSCGLSTEPPHRCCRVP